MFIPGLNDLTISCVRGVPRFGMAEIGTSHVAHLGVVVAAAAGATTAALASVPRNRRAARRRTGLVIRSRIAIGLERFNSPVGGARTTHGRAGGVEALRPM